MSHLTDFVYIDVAFGSVANRNHIIKADSLNEYAKNRQRENHNEFKDCFKTYFQYSDELLDHVKRTGSVRGFDGSCWANFFPLDIDSADLEESLNDTKAIVIKLRDEFEVDPKNLRIYFSGAKGFHIEIPGNLFGGFAPSPRLNEEFKALAKLISEDVDLTIYDKVRLWRLPRTINPKSGLYKIPLSAEELFNHTIDDIKDMAKKPREGSLFDPNMNVNEPLRGLYEQAREGILKANEKPKGEKKYARLINGKVHEGARNSTLTSYGGKLKACNIPENEAFTILSALNEVQCLPPLDEKEVETIFKIILR